MSIKTFNVDDDAYQKFSSYCKENGLSMSKQITWFMKSQIEEPPVRKEYLAKIERLRKGKFIEFKNVDEFEKKFGLK
jgi:antitoxin component of RelBE/YafQ-DinJ toxin-antitoxin module